ncbi:MAG TPA: DUF1045 domain-containing protein [Acetobacteraceae bacterium]|nr:DUF1045 domain-containing protein [Acetobacteraceae bacterium]
MRVALYWAPPADDPLWALGSAWLGRDAETGLAVAQPDMPGLAALTGSPRRYGFHATLKAPIALAGTFEEFLADARALARKLSAATLPPLAVRKLGDFAALCPTGDIPDLASLAAALVTGLDHHRLPEPPETQARRARGLTPAQAAHLARWGYPYVLEEWRFHMTLSDNGAATPSLLAEAARYFAPVLEKERPVREFFVFVEPAPGAPFHLAERVALAT